MLLPEAQSCNNSQLRIDSPHLPYAFSLRVYPNAEDLAREIGIGVLDSRGERAEAHPL